MALSAPRGTGQMAKLEETGLKGKLPPGVSVVVCCYNSAQVIEPTISALAQQDVPQGTGYEVILVDNNCTDTTVQLAKDTWKNPIHPLKIIKEKEPGLIFARKAGVRCARYNILLFVDDDNILGPDWLVKLYGLFERWPKVGAVGGYNEPIFEGDKPEWFDDFAGVFACKPQSEKSGILIKRNFLFGAGLSFRTPVIRSIFFSDLPLFLIGREKNILLRGEDSEICMRTILMGWDLWYENSLKLKHYLLKRKINWEYVLNARKGGGTADVILRIYRDLINHKPPPDYHSLSSQICRKWRSFWEVLDDITEIQEEGSKKAFDYFYLNGLTEGLLKMGEHKYHQIKEKITEFYLT